MIIGFTRRRAPKQMSSHLPGALSYFITVHSYCKLPAYDRTEYSPVIR